MDDAESLISLYTEALIALSAEANKAVRLPQADVRGEAVSPICGSKVMVELTLKDGRVTGFGYELEACALTKSVVAVMKSAIMGKTYSEIARAGEQLQAMLEGGEPPTGDWARLEMLRPVTDYRSRHSSILLPFEAVEKALKEKGKT